MAHPDLFFRKAWLGGAPLLVWALHLFGAYAFVAISCCSAFAETQWFGVAAPRLVLLAASVLALAAIVALLLRGLREPESLLRTASTGTAALALIGVAWTTLPMLLMPMCRCG
ncbi:MAG TPA: hypothetical protein VFG60_08835 [Burkholderiaceae bacterium]|nr:hypothetical protein [Burkholderiaceae bacterium]